EVDETAANIVNQALSGAPTDLTASFSRQRTGGGEIPNLYNLVPRYRKTMAADLGYKDAMDYLAENVDKIPAALRADASNTKALAEYATELVDRAINGVESN